MLRGIFIAILSIGVAGTAYWGYQEHKEKNAILLNAENNYQRAFHDLAYQIDLLHDEIGATLAMNSRQSLSPALAEVWRITSEAHNDVGQLPLALLPFNKTEEFLANIGEFSYRTAIRDLGKEPLTEQEYKTLQSLYSNAADIQEELRKVQSLVIKNNLRWMDVELALATEEKQMDNTIIDGFKTVEKNVEAYSEADFGPTFTSMEQKDKDFKYLEGKMINEQEAEEIAKKFLGIKEPVEISVTSGGDGSDYGFYSLTINDKENKLEANMDLTKKGGYPVWFIQNRDVKEQNISLNEASTKAAKFLKEHKFEHQELFETAQYDNVGVFTFVANENGVRIYPEAIKMKVALDEGGIIGFSARDFLMSHFKRKIPEPVISVEEAREKINPNVTIMEEREAIIVNDLNEEVLCYEFLGTINNDTYRIFINTENGYEEKVEKLKNAEPVYEEL